MTVRETGNRPPPHPDRDACTYGNTDGNGDADGYPDVHRHRHTYRYPNAEPDRDVHCRHTRVTPPLTCSNGITWNVSTARQVHVHEGGNVWLTKTVPTDSG